MFKKIIVSLVIFVGLVVASSQMHTETASEAAKTGKIFVQGVGNKDGSAIGIGIPIYQSPNNDFGIGVSVGRVGGWQRGTGSYGGGIGLNFRF